MGTLRIDARPVGPACPQAGPPGVGTRRGYLSVPQAENLETAMGGPLGGGGPDPCHSPRRGIRDGRGL